MNKKKIPDMRAALSRVAKDKNGKIEPTAEAFAKVEKEYADKSPAERYQLAQAQTLLDAQREASNRGGGSDGA
jgi:hypothetical protein